MIVKDLRRRLTRSPHPEPQGCAAPSSTLYFAPDGAVRACCVNTDHPLGHIGEQSLHEIWRGAPIAELREALDRDDYSLGCQSCGTQTAAGNRAWSNAPQFDPFAQAEPGSYPRRMDFILSITCNLQCVMCSGDLSSAIRSQREHRPPLRSPYGDAFFDELREFLPHLEEAMFLGGEPFLARESQRVWDLMIEMDCRPRVTVVTNGTQWSPKVERYLRELPMNVTFSVDGATAETVEALRAGARFAELRANVDRYEAIIGPKGGSVGFHYCLMPQNWHEFGAFLLDADAHDRFVIVMTVTEPAEFSLFRLPRDELSEVVAALDDEGRSIRARLGRNAPVWIAELDRLHRHLDEVGRGVVPVWVPVASPEVSSAARPSV